MRIAPTSSGASAARPRSAHAEADAPAEEVVWILDDTPLGEPADPEDD